MSGPGTGRYTTYVPVASSRNKLLRDLFNGRAPNGAGVFYGKLDQTDNIDAAKEVVKASSASVVSGVGGLIPSDGLQAGDPGMFPTGVDLTFGNAPNLSDVKWDSAKFSFNGSTTDAGGPANSFVPDISSPGPGKTQGIDKDANPNLAAADLKPNYVPGAPGTGTTSPDATSKEIGSSPIGKSLTMGKSSV